MNRKRKLDLLAECWAIISSIAAFIGFIIICVNVWWQLIPWWYILLYILVVAPSLCLLYAFNGIVNRVVDLEREAIKNNPEYEKEGEDEGKEEVELCKKCGYQLFEEDEVCPNCKHKR